MPEIMGYQRQTENSLHLLIVMIMWVIGQIVCPVLGQSGVPWYFGWGVEFVPVDAGFVSHRDPGRLPCTQRAVFPGFPVERFDLSVRDGVVREPRVGFRMHGVLVAPPAHLLDLPAPGTGPGAGAACRGCVRSMTR